MTVSKFWNIIYQVKYFSGRSVDKNRQINILSTVAFITDQWIWEYIMVRFSASLCLFVCHAVYLPIRIVIKIQTKPVKVNLFCERSVRGYKLNHTRVWSIKIIHLLITYHTRTTNNLFAELRSKLWSME